MSTTAMPNPNPPPAPTLKPTFDKHLDAVKWVIGLPVAILFGTTQFVDKIDFVKHPGAGRLLAAIVIVSALTTVLSVAYYFLRIKLADHKILGTDVPPAIQFLASATYYVSLFLFLIAFVLTVIGLVEFPGVQLDKTPPLPPVAEAPPHFTITTSGPVKDRKGTHVHTFLLDQNTGEVWKMECSSTGVHFVRVSVQDLPSKAKPPAK